MYFYNESRDENKQDPTTQKLIER